MDFGNNKNCISQPDVCRCCLASQGSWDLTASYTADTGIKEVYSELLQKCFGITLSCLSEVSDWGCSRMICELCLRELRSTYAFRRKVLDAETQFVEYWKDLTSQTDKFEEDQSTFTTLLSPDDNYDDSKDHLEGQKRLCTKKGKQKKTRHKKEIVELWDDLNSDSDIPLVQLTSKNDISRLDGQESLNKGNHLDICDENRVEKINFCIEDQYPKQDVKLVSERKRVKLTCEIVLTDTTACPFRHHKSWFQCFFCSEDFMEINLLRSHFQKTHNNIEEELNNIKCYPRSLQIDISELKCRHCDLTLTDVDAMTRHFEFSHQKVIYKECIADYKVNVSPYTCHLCQREFHVFRTLTTHLNVHYANCICDVCGKSFLNSKRLKVHKRTHENGTYPCNECGKILKTKTSRANHMESAHSKRVVKCQICFKPMKHYNDRIKHMSEVHNITHKFKCSICSREYNIKHYLATHMRQTHGHKNKKCLECGMAFITNHGLKKHMLRHSGEKPYACTVCSKSYVRSSTLRDHMRVHDNDKKISSEHIANAV